MEVAAWALGGLLPAAILAEDKYDAFYLPAHFAHAVSLGIVCGRFKRSWKITGRAVLILAAVHLILSPVLGSIFVLNNRSNRPLSLHLLPVAFSGMNPAPGNSEPRIFWACLIWSMVMGWMARLILEPSDFCGQAKALLRSGITFGPILWLHLYLVPDKIYWWDAPTEDDIDLKATAGVYSLMALYAGFHLALFADQFHKEVVAE